MSFNVAIVMPDGYRRVTDYIRRKLEAEGCTVTVSLSDEGNPPEKQRELLRNADAYVTGALESVTAEAIAEAGSLSLIQRFGAGFDNVDGSGAREHGVDLANIPSLNAVAVAELTVGMYLTLLRRIPYSDRLMRNGDWRVIVGDSLEGKTLGLVGMGAIGRLVARRAAAFNVKIISFDAFPDYEFARASGIEVSESLEELLERSDIVSIHVPSNEHTRNLINKERIGLMKEGSFLINTARGDVVDETAIIEALSSGRLAGAALDVFSKEPIDRENLLLSLDNVVVTPHLGGSTHQALQNMGDVVIANCLRAKRGEPRANIVN